MLRWFAVKAGRRPRTDPYGVTAILPHDGSLTRDAILAAIYNHNGNGEMTGYLRVRESGLIASPIMLTGVQRRPRVRPDARLTWPAATQTSVSRIRCHPVLRIRP
jgi:hypothetical protein